MKQLASSPFHLLCPPSQKKIQENLSKDKKHQFVVVWVLPRQLNQIPKLLNQIPKLLNQIPKLLNQIPKLLSFTLLSFVSVSSRSYLDWQKKRSLRKVAASKMMRLFPSHRRSHSARVGKTVDNFEIGNHGMHGETMNIYHVLHIFLHGRADFRSTKLLPLRRSTTNSRVFCRGFLGKNHPHQSLDVDGSFEIRRWNNHRPWMVLKPW